MDVFDINAATWTKPETRVRHLHLPLLTPGGQRQNGFDRVSIDYQGQPPRPRSQHASATLGNRGYVSGGVVSAFKQFSTHLQTRTCLEDAVIQLCARLQDAAQLDMFCLDLETWTWTQLYRHSNSVTGASPVLLLALTICSFISATFP